ncbi:FK506-binding protein 2B [Coemansia sp. RSA 2336]|nr:FK506-binding protein 2B [Coemansia sp. RSA 2336]
MSQEPKWTAEELAGDAVSKKELVGYLQENGSNEFLLKHKLNGKLANVVKTSKKPHLISAYTDLFETKQFRAADEPSASQVKQVKSEASAETNKPAKASNEIKYEKRIIKAGKAGERMPEKGDRVSVFYTGKLKDGQVFDTNTEPKGKKPAAPLVFKVGTGQVIRGWDEGLLTMARGEKAELTIKPEWAYGQKGNSAGGIPPNATLVFTVELVDIF